MRTEREDYFKKKKKSKRKEKDVSIIKSSELKQKKLHTKYLNSPVYWFKQHTLHLKKRTRKKIMLNQAGIPWLSSG